MLSEPSSVWYNQVAQIMAVEEVTLGEGKDAFAARYRGRIYGDSAEAYDRLAAGLKPLDMTPLFRLVKGEQVILLMRGVIRVRPSNPWVNLVMFLLTIASTLFVGAQYSYDGSAPFTLATVLSGWPYAVSLLAILVAHEFGHYLAGRYHKTAVTLPYFIPLPLNFGTLGAFIQLKEPPKNRRILLDIGVAGPLAGLVIAIPVLLFGLATSPLSQLPANLPPTMFEGNSLLYLFLKYVVHGQLLPAPADFGGLPPLLYWARYFFTGLPLPAGGVDVSLNSIAWAGWAGLLVTALNLIPAGQLDGGHLLYVLLGKRAALLLPVIVLALAGLALLWPGWWLWVAIILLLGRFHAEPLDQITPLDPARRMVAVLGLVIFILVFMPIPMTLAGV
jgi:membrane-associated protease RseP (regulator of RpoE activity)